LLQRPASQTRALPEPDAGMSLLPGRCGRGSRNASRALNSSHTHLAGSLDDPAHSMLCHVPNVAVLYVPQADLHTQWLPVYGSSGGTAFALDCGNGRVMTGVRTRAARLVDAVGLICRPVNANGTLGSETTVGPLAGGGGGSVEVRRCAADAVVAGLDIRYGNVVDGFGINCKSWKASTRSVEGPPDGGGPHVGKVGMNRSREVSRCESIKQPASGLRGRAAMLVDAIGLVCDEP